MNIEETGKLLGLIQVMDNRRIDEATLLAWAPLLEDIDYREGVEAVNLHRRESKEYLLPAHVRDNVLRIRNVIEDPTDQWGNPLDQDMPALDAQRRLRASQRLAVGR